MTVKTKLLCGLATLTILFFLSSCSGCTSNQSQGGGESRQPDEAPVNPEVELVDKIADKAFTAKVDEIRNDLILVTEIGTHKTHSLNYGQAELEDKIIGDLRAGATYSILTDEDCKRVIIAVNLDELKGRWFYDMQELRGFIFESRGGFSSINSGDISYREWALKNGKLYVFYVTREMVAPQRNEYLVEEAEIVKLTQDHLVMKLAGKTYDCRRQTEAVQFQMNP